MRHKYATIVRLLALMLVAALFMTACSKGPEEPEPTIPEPTTAPTIPTEPTAPPERTAHEKLYAYLATTGAVTVEEKTYTFTMRAEKERIIWEYKNASTNVTISLSDGAKMHPVSISFADFVASAEIEAATYTNTNGKLSNFQCSEPTMAQALGNMATTVVWTCFNQAAKAMAPSGVDLVALGFVKYFG